MNTTAWFDATAVLLWAWAALRPYTWPFMRWLGTLLLDSTRIDFHGDPSEVEKLRPHVVVGRRRPRGASAEIHSPPEPVSSKSTRPRLINWPESVRAPSEPVVVSPSQVGSEVPSHPYAAGESFLARIDGSWVFVKLVPPTTDESGSSKGPYHLWLVGLTGVRVALRLLRRVPRRGVTNLVELNYGVGTFKGSQQLETRGSGYAFVEEPGRGCDPAVWRSLLDYATHLRDRAEAKFRKGHDTGGACLLVGPPGTGKTTLATHLGVALELPCVIKLTVSAGGDLGSPPIDDGLIGHIGICEGDDAGSWKGRQDRMGLILIDDVDRAFQREGGLSVGPVLTWVDRMCRQPNLLVFTANDITHLDPAFLSRMLIIHVGPPTTDTLPEKMQALLDCSEEEAAAWSTELGDEVKNLRQLAKVARAARPGEDFPTAWRRVISAERESELRAIADGSRWVTPAAETKTDG